MTLGATLPLVLLVLLLIVLVLLARRAARALAMARATTAFTAEVTAMAGRLGPVLESLVERVDAVRRHLLPAQEAAPGVVTARDTIAAERGSLGTWRAPVGFEALALALGDDLDQLGRAIELLEHGIGLLAADRGRQGKLESQTAIKRGYLGLLHGRQAFDEHVADVERLAATLRTRRGRRV